MQQKIGKATLDQERNDHLKLRSIKTRDWCMEVLECSMFFFLSHLITLRFGFEVLANFSKIPQKS